MKNRSIRFSMLLVLAALALSMTSCDYFVDVDFKIAREGNDTLVLIGWNGANEIRYSSPYTSNSGDVYESTTISSFGVMGGRHIYVTDEQAFTNLMSDYDSVMLTRSSDGATSIVFRHDENATEEQRYFFTREAWRCDPEGETEKDRTYTLILPPMGCFDLSEILPFPKKYHGDAFFESNHEI